ncbi:sensor histidine kinase [Paracoccus aestuariivivens]|uniref:histidine kinase n=1 Tax=Paracoccus aestuariivivens TaxID=1820333 RepID=A0A6L6JEL3_9RHOB|nr:sensor histidine kinase [Paracoccus aestuariivivens]MTH79675.1 sensor histidine kinase [Paracoccus aestuariivivens]
MILRDSIRARLIGLAAILIGAALVAGYLAIAAILDRFVTDRFDADAEATADALIASATIDGSGRLVAGGAPIDPRFDLPLSGWFWQLEQDGRAVAKSASLYDNVMHPPDADFVGGPGTGHDGTALRVLRHEFSLPDTTSPLAVIVAIPRAEIDASVAQVRRPLAISLIVLGLVLALASVLQVAAGLSSLDRLGRDLRAIRNGRADALPLPRVAELQPLASEINGLIDQNRQVLSRTREHVGNLAHSLKTPLSALSNSLPEDHPGHGLVARMDRQIGWHLRRARSSGSARTLGQRTALAPVVDDILMVLRGPLGESGIRVEQDLPATLAFAGERQDLEEMIGNLIENAVKWANTHIIVKARSEGTGRLSITIEDDGPGMSAEDHALAMARGGRLDESGPPGTGLGLAIVSDLARLHGGALRLERSKLGGLSARLLLPT